MTINIEIKVTPAENRTWKTLAEVRQRYTEAEVVAMVHRYQDAQDHAIKYRKNKAMKDKMMKARLAELEAKMAMMGDQSDEGEEEEGA